MIIRRELYYSSGPTIYDRTDNLKRIKDSDILAEKKKSNLGSYAKAAGSGIAGGVAGTAVGLAAGLLGKKGSLARGLKFGAVGGAAGSTIAGGLSLAGGHNKRKENREYNKRLDSAKGQARRREMKDWVQNTRSRDGYSY